MAFTLSEIMAARRQQSQAQPHAQRGSRTAVEVDEYSTNPTQAFTFYNINQGRFQPPHVHMWVDVYAAGELIKGKYHCCLDLLYVCISFWYFPVHAAFTVIK